MALDARVYCDCLESGRVEGFPGRGLSLQVEPDGSSWLYKDGNLVDHDHQDCKRYTCPHPNRVLVSHRLVNIGLIALLRSELKREPEKFPILLEKVIYDGIHCGDWLSLETVNTLRIELDRLRTVQTVGTKAEAGFVAVILKNLGIVRSAYISARESARFIHFFREQMLELSEASLSTGKPIAF